MSSCYCAQTAGYINMPFGMDVGLTLGDFVLDGDPVPLPKKGAEPPPQKKIGPCLLWPNTGLIKALPLHDTIRLWPNGWMDQDATWHESKPQPRRLCVSLGPSRPLPKRTDAPIFGPRLL